MGRELYLVLLPRGLLAGRRLAKVELVNRMPLLVNRPPSLGNQPPSLGRPSRVNTRLSQAPRRVVMKVLAFHTTSPEYPPSHRNVYHDRSERRYGQEIKRDGKDVPGDGGRPRCDLCKSYG